MQTHTSDRKKKIFSYFTDTKQIRVKNWNGQFTQKAVDEGGEVDSN
jgi:hypothetical protein